MPHPQVQRSAFASVSAARFCSAFNNVKSMSGRSRSLYLMFGDLARP